MEIKKVKHILEDYPKDWPPKKYFIDQHKVTHHQYEEFKALVDKGAGEIEIDKFLRNNKEILSNALSFFRTGHHGSWIIPQQDIKPSTHEPGLRPDYLIGGKNSDGFTWGIIDLKSSDAKIFSKEGNRVFFSNIVNKGVFQVLEYMNYCSKMQTYMREGLNLVNFRETSGLLIIGREKELDENSQRKELRAAWNRLTNGNLCVRTYDALLRALEQNLGSKLLPNK